LGRVGLVLVALVAHCPLLAVRHGMSWLTDRGSTAALGRKDVINGDDGAEPSPPRLWPAALSSSQVVTSPRLPLHLHRSIRWSATCPGSP